MGSRTKKGHWLASAGACWVILLAGCASGGNGWKGQDAGWDASDAMLDPAVDASDAQAADAERPCGNGRLDPGEECDGTNLNGQRCEDLATDYVGGQLRCSGDCTFDTSACIRRGCGNGVIDAGESCDDGNLDTGDGCGADCQVESGWRCTGEPSRCEKLCGNGTVDPGEDCDGTNLGGQTCTSIPGGFTGGQLGCGPDCRFDTSNCSTCGNGDPEPGEQCDDGNREDGDGCSSACQWERLPTLYRFVGGLWHSQLVTWKDQPHAPREAVVAAAELPSMGIAYVFTQNTYHVLQVPSLVWREHGSLSALFPQVPPGAITCAYGVGWPNQDGTMYVATGNHYYQYTVDIQTGQVSFVTDDQVPWDTSQPHVPEPTRVVAMWADLDNAGGWAPGTKDQICANGAAEPVGPYVGALTNLARVHLFEGEDCFVWYADMPYTSYTPFGVSGGPAAAQVSAAFYVSPVLYVFTTP